MRIFLILSIVLSLYAEDLKLRTQKLIAPIEKTLIVRVKYDPFKKGQEVVQKIFSKKVQDNTLYVTAILNNKAFINSRWYRVGEKVDGYKIIQLKENSILVKNSKKVLKFSIKRRDNIVKVKDK
jgi:hypothetical protein